MKWRRKQQKDAKDFGGKETPRSGGFWSFAGDVVSEDLLIESKDTDKKSWSIKGETWDKVEHEALMARKTPIISLDLQGRELVIVDKQKFIELLENQK